MSTAQFNQSAYGLTQPEINIFPAPIVSNRAPTTADKSQIGTIWIFSPSNTTYIITSIANNQANWVLLASGGGTLDQITTNAGIVIPAGGNVNLVGGGATNITTSGAGSTATVAIISSPSFAGTTTVATGLVATTGNIVATAGQVNAGTSMTAGTGITATTGNITATAGNIQALTGSVSANTTVTAGTTLIGTTGIECLAFGVGVVQSNGAGVFSSTNGTNGQVLIAATAGTPTWASITAGSGITITPGANTLTIAASASAPSVSFLANLTADQTAVTGDGTIVNLICNSAISNVGSGYNTTTGIFTAPNTGLYQFSTTVSLTGMIADNEESQIYFVSNLSSSAFNYFIAEINPFAMADISGSVVAVNGTITISMTAGDTMQVQLFVGGDVAKTTSILSSGGNLSLFQTWFTGYLI